MPTIFHDLKHAVRIHLKTAGFTLIAVLTLALGIGASTTVFSVVNAILIRPLPYPGAERIVIPWRRWPVQYAGFNEVPWGRRTFRDMLSESKVFESIGAFRGDSFNLTGAGEPAHIGAIDATPGFFRALGVQAAIGRTFTDEEGLAGHDHVVVLSDRIWREKFSADRAILGRAVQLNSEPYVVVGVMPAWFSFPRSAEMPGSFAFPHEPRLWVPQLIPASTPREEPDELAVVARMKPGVTIGQAQAGMDRYEKLEERVMPDGKGYFGSRVRPLVRQITGDTRMPLLLILGAVGVVLLIACANVASLLVTRSLARRREFTLRVALGAGRGRLIRQLLTESLLLASAGGVSGLALAAYGVRFVKIFGPSGIPRLQETTLEPPVFIFALGVTLITGVLFGLAPALGAGRQNLAESLREGTQRSGGPSSPRLRNTLLVGEVALAVVLVISAGLLLRTFSRLLATDGGFNAERVLTFEFSLPAIKYKDTAAIVQFYNRALEKLRAAPGVESAGIGETVPMQGAGEGTGIRIPGYSKSSDQDQLYAAYTMVSSGYFSAVGTPILRGRPILESDTPDSMPVCVVSNAMAKKFWPNGDALGKQVGPGSPKYPVATIVGIVADAKHVSLREEVGAEMYVPFNQKVWPSLLTMQAAVRTKADPAGVIGGIREAVRVVDPELPVAKLTTLANLVDESMTAPRFSMLLLGSFGLLAVALAAIGMYGVISYSVAQRTREIGIRMALGAERRGVFGLVLMQGARLAGLGIVIGVVTALAATRLMTRFLYGVAPSDPLTYAAVSILLLAVALFACYVPARRATRVDPMVALRYE